MGIIQKAGLFVTSLGKGLAKNGTTSLVDVFLSANAGNKLAFGSDNGLFASQFAFPVTGFSSLIGQSIQLPTSQPGAYFDIDGTGSYTLPPASAGSATSPFWLYLRRRDGVASAIKIPVNGSDLISQGVTRDEAGSAVTLDSGYVTLYQEEVGLVSFGGGTWYFVPGTRQRGWIEAGVASIVGGNTTLTLAVGFGDVEVSDLTLSSPATSLTAVNSYLTAQLNSSSGAITTLYSQGGMQCTTGTTLAAVTTTASAWKLSGPANGAPQVLGWETTFTGQNSNGNVLARMTAQAVFPSSGSGVGTFAATGLNTNQRPVSVTLSVSSSTFNANSSVHCKVFRR